MRCERCKTSELKLVTFGVYDCPVCGRVDADGNVLEQQAGADDTGPVTFESERASFVAPPPAGAPAPAFVASSAPVAGDMPQIFLVTLVISAILDLGQALSARSVIAFFLRMAFYGALLSGKAWARSWSLAMTVLSAVLCVVVALVIPGAPPIVKALLTAGIVMDAWWLYVLLRPDTVAYFSRAR